MIELIIDLFNRMDGESCGGCGQKLTAHVLDIYGYSFDLPRFRLYALCEKCTPVKLHHISDTAWENLDHLLAYGEPKHTFSQDEDQYRKTYKAELLLLPRLRRRLECDMRGCQTRFDGSLKNIKYIWWSWAFQEYHFACKKCTNRNRQEPIELK